VGAWNDHDSGKVAACYADNYEGEDVAEASVHHGPSHIREITEAGFAAFPDLKLRIEHCLVDGDCVGVFWMATGTHQGRVMNIPPTGRHIEMRGAVWLRVAGGKIVNGLQVWDVAGMLRSIGLLPDLTN